MKYLKFNKAELVNLEYSTFREFVRTNRAGSYSSSTIIGCNTRKYHGLMVCPVSSLGDEKFVLLSSVDETVIQRDAEFNLGIHKYGPDTYFPKGHKYIVDFDIEYIPKITYRVGGVVFTKEFVLVNEKEQVLIKYTLVDAHSPTRLRLRPMLANRGIHELGRANISANGRVNFIKNGISSQMYETLPALYMQMSKECDFVQIPDWYYGIEYAKEQERGYDYKEDLFTPGYFEVDIKKGESVLFSASLSEESPAGFSKKYSTDLKKRILRNGFFPCLKNAAQQFIVRRDGKTEVIAGYPWFGAWGRDTFIALSGLTLTLGDTKTCKDALDTMVKRMNGGLFPNMGGHDTPAFNSVDAPLWFFSTLQRYAEVVGNKEVWKAYKKAMKSILNGFRNGLPYNIKMHDNGLIWQGIEGKALTWMDAVVNGMPVTPRTGYAVEINLLWYNAVCWYIDLAKENGEPKEVLEWEGIPEKTAVSFVENFWSVEKGYLADCTDGIEPDWAIRPNQIFGTSLPYSPITPEMQISVLDVVTKQLLTPRGLRTLSPDNINYKGVYNGDQDTRDRAYHQGTVWPWLLEAYSIGYLKMNKRSGKTFIKKLVEGFEEEMTVHGIGSISEIYNGNPPHDGRGAVSQAWSVAALLTMMKMADMIEEKPDRNV